MSRRIADPRQLGFARTMRRNMTEAEFRLWLRLRARAVEGLKFRRQVPIGPFIVDFFCAERRLVVEIDGSQHFAEAAIAADARRTAWLEARGFRVLRLTNPDVMNNVEAVYRAIADAAEQARSEPSP
ncbi:endonuclease domain-containing protein [Kaistia defluvii]|uniref:endonuclease domain-containing protein n=1 Tax=Kaistia defluvii TaxID=410841 RepID=UPI00225338E8|nr:endonuclease domain-containing protein [Kaistia defluvii]MCX5518696.1 endonuclease domain-containing protein [Kaistia defluvii]